MARVTVEDCIEKIPNRFDLILTAAQRARELGSGAELTIDRDRDKDPVVSLREIAEETVSIDTLQESIIKGYQRVRQADEEEDLEAFLEREVLGLEKGEEMEGLDKVFSDMVETDLEEDGDMTFGDTSEGFDMGLEGNDDEA